MIAKKSLGQNFLTNKNKIIEIVESLDLKEGDVVIEIGPGHGELTEEIVNKFLSLKVFKFKAIAIEKDEELAKELKIKFQGNKNVEIMEGDALKLLSQLTDNQPARNPSDQVIRAETRSGGQLITNNYKIVGNIPYYITGFLFRILGELENKPELVVLTIQKEVAERVCAHPVKMDSAHKKCSACGMNLLAASVQFWAEAEIISNIPKKYFNPVPKVDSAIIRLKVDGGKRKNEKEREKYYHFIKILFKQPRKTILNNLKLIADNQRLIKEKLESLKINPLDRPQNLSIGEIIQLSEIFSGNF